MFNKNWRLLLLSLENKIKWNRTIFNLLFKINKNLILQSDNLMELPAHSKHIENLPHYQKEILLVTIIRVAMATILVINLKVAKKYSILKTIKTYFQLQFLKKIIKLMIGLFNYLLQTNKWTFKNKNKILQLIIIRIVLVLLSKIVSVKE